MLLQPPGPRDVGLLVKASLDLNQGQHLLAGLGRLDQGVDDGGVAGGAVEGLLDREDVWIISCLFDEALHARCERVVRVVQQHISLLEGSKHVRGLRRFDLGEVGMGVGKEGRVP